MKISKITQFQTREALNHQSDSGEEQKGRERGDQSKGGPIIL